MEKLGPNSASTEQATDGPSPSNAHSESIVNVVAILSDGRTTMRGPSGTGFYVKTEGSASQCEIVTSLHSIIPDSRAPLKSLEITSADGSKSEGVIVAKPSVGAS